jgi:hypothetical protein
VLRRALALPLLVAAVAAGCGGDGEEGPETPKARENLQSFQARLETAVAAIGQGHCDAVKEFNSRAGLPLPCDARAKKLFTGFKVTGARTYGTGGIVEFQSAETKGNVGVYVIAVGEDGRYHLTGGPLGPIVEKSTLDEEPKREEEMDRAAQAMVDAIRSNDCNRFLADVVTPQGLEKDEICDQELSQAYGPLHTQLTRHRDAKPERLDGNAAFMFYALRTGSEYRTLVVTRTGPGAPKPFLGFVTFKGPLQKGT